MAQAILLKDVDKLGESGDVIDVSPATGHAGRHCGRRAPP
jgi:ribosomal protein L9